MKYLTPIAAFLAFSIAASILMASFAAEATNCGVEPPAKSNRVKGGEGFPPLPLPVTPLRRTEKKRPPSPPTLIIKMAYGAKITTKDDDGKEVTYYDWTTDYGDIRNLLARTSSILGMPYTSREMKLEEFSFDPTETPIVYFTGHEPFSWTDEQRAKLAAYVVNGGTIWGDACCGDKRFADAFRHEMLLMFPNRPLHVLDPDHPLYSIYYPITKVPYKENERVYTDVPKLQGINIGCRTAVIFTPIDLSCGWDGHTHDKGHRYGVGASQNIGVNMFAYALAYYKTGLMLRYEVKYEDKRVEGNEDFFIGHVKHNGDWDPNPSALQNLMLETSRETKVKVNFQVKDVDLASTDLFQFPFLYMCGHFNFELGDEEKAALKKYLDRGGFLLAESCCGRIGFDASFRKIITEMYPEKKLERIPTDHELFKIHFPIKSVTYTPLVQKEKPGFASPYLEGIEIDGKYVVVYSRYGIGNGWERIPHPNTRGVESRDALRIGVNSIIYSMTH